MNKTVILVYAAVAYLVGLVNIAYLVGFLADLGVPKTVSSGSSVDSPAQAALTDALHVLGFGCLHSLTARASFKRWWTRIVPPAIERSTYLYVTAVATGLLVVLWQPIPVTLWRVEAPWSAAILAAYFSTWAVMFGATFQVGHFGFFGLKQAWQHVRGGAPSDAAFCARWLYALVRHPISLGWMLVPWLTPHMTLGQCVFALATLVYVLAATVFEEADLTAELGETYRRYRSEVPAFLPFIRRSARR